MFYLPVPLVSHAKPVNIVCPGSSVSMLSMPINRQFRTKENRMRLVILCQHARGDLDMCPIVRLTTVNVVQSKCKP